MYLFSFIIITLCLLVENYSFTPAQRISSTSTLRPSHLQQKHSLLFSSKSEQQQLYDTTLESDAEFNINREVMTSLLSKRSYISVLTERAIQALDDGQVEGKVKKAARNMIKGTTSSISVNEHKFEKEKIIILGTGWGSHGFLKTIDTTRYDVTVISPRNFFLFTPMLAASAVGTVEFKSICDPIRDVNPLADYLEASATAIDVHSKTIACQSIKCEGTSCEFIEFSVDYDYLIIAVGAATNTFGIKGVRENCLFLKQVDDASNIRRSIVNCFERANVPSLSDDERRATLSFVVVGAGPTGVEFTSELRDWLEVEGKRYYSKLLKFVSLTLIEAGPTVLPVFDEALRDEALKRLTQRDTNLIKDGLIEKEFTNVLLKAGVKEIGDQRIQLSTGDNIPYGFCVWAAGNGPLPFVNEFIHNMDEQKNRQNSARGRIVTDRWLKVLGTDSVFALGDCALIDSYALPATAQVASQGGSYLGRVFSKRFNMKVLSGVPPSKSDGTQHRPGVLYADNSRYLSEIIRVGGLGVKEESKEIAIPFQFLNLGVLAYIGASQALAQVSVDEKNILGSGQLGFLLWRGVYWFKQVSWRNRMLVAIDWFKARLFGRDIGTF